MAKYNDVECFMYYLYNKWDRTEAIKIYGETLGNHIYEKWISFRRNKKDSLEWYGELDRECRDRILLRALELYGKQ